MLFQLILGRNPSCGRVVLRLTITKLLREVDPVKVKLMKGGLLYSFFPKRVFNEVVIPIPR